MRQPTVALSSAEAEFSASTMDQEVTYLRKFLANLGYPQTAPTHVFADNETCIAWSEGSVGCSDAPSILTCMCTRLALLVISNSASSTAKSTQLTSSPSLPRLPTSSKISVAASWATETQVPVCASGGGDECLRRWEPFHCRLGGVMNISGVE